MLAVMTVVELELLLTMSRIFGGVHVDHDLLRRILKVAFDEQTNQLQAHSKQILSPNTILEPRESRLSRRNSA